LKSIEFDRLSTNFDQNKKEADKKISNLTNLLETSEQNIKKKDR